jgi:hypothetical protein
MSWKFQEMQRVDEVLKHAKRREESIPMFQYCNDAYGAEGKIDECIEKGLHFVKLLGVELPKRYDKMTVVYYFGKDKNVMRRINIDMLMNYTTSNDLLIVTSLKILSTIASYTFQT